MLCTFRENEGGKVFFPHLTLPYGPRSGRLVSVTVNAASFTVSLFLFLCIYIYIWPFSTNSLRILFIAPQGGGGRRKEEGRDVEKAKVGEGCSSSNSLELR